MSAGKGDRLRRVNKQRFDDNFDAINWKRRKRKCRCYACRCVDAGLPEGVLPETEVSDDKP